MSFGALKTVYSNQEKKVKYYFIDIIDDRNDKDEKFQAQKSGSKMLELTE